MIKYVTIEKYEIDLSKGEDFISAIRLVEDSGIDLKRFKVIKFHEGTHPRLVVQRVQERTLNKAELLDHARTRLVVGGNTSATTLSTLRSHR